MKKHTTMPWAAWSKPNYVKLEFPQSWQILDYQMKGADLPKLTQHQIKSAIDQPYNSQVLLP